MDRVDEAQMRLKHYSSLENHLRDGHVDRVDEAQMRLKQSPTVSASNSASKWIGWMRRRCD